MKICIFSFTDKGRALAEEISKIEDIDFRNEAVSFVLERRTDFYKEDFSRYDGLIFIGAAGIAVRKIAPFVKSKTSDPAVIVIDERCQFIIPILSGHIGGANGISEILARRLKAECVITTATDVNGFVAIDEIAAKNRMIIKNPEAIKLINSRILKGESIKIYCSEFIEPEFDHSGVYKLSPKSDADVVISSDKRINDNSQLHIFNRRIVLGIGCRRDTDSSNFERVVNSILSEAKVTPMDVDIIASIDIKSHEPAIVRYAGKYNIYFRTYSAEELSKVQGDFDHSDFVKEITGVSNVSERAAVLAGNYGHFLVKRRVEEGITVSVFEEIKRIKFNGKA